MNVCFIKSMHTQDIGDFVQSHLGIFCCASDNLDKSALFQLLNAKPNPPIKNYMGLCKQYITSLFAFNGNEGHKNSYSKMVYNAVQKFAIVFPWK